MTVLHPHRAPAVSAATTSGSRPAAEESTRQVTPRAAQALALLRIGFGLTFLWAFFDKLLALGFHTGYNQDGVLDRFGEAAWVNGGSPTVGFLSFGTDGPFADAYQSIAGLAWVDWLFMLGLLGIGTAFTLGIAMRAAAASGALLYLMMWSAALPPETNPVIDDHVLGAISLVALAAVGAGRTWGLGRAWGRMLVVRRYAALR